VKKIDLKQLILEELEKFSRLGKITLFNSNKSSEWKVYVKYKIGVDGPNRGDWTTNWKLYSIHPDSKVNDGFNDGDEVKFFIKQGMAYITEKL